MNKLFMEKAVELAKNNCDDIPVAAVIVKNNEIIAACTNEKEKRQNPLLHAEISAINETCKKLGRWRLDDCEIYVTLEPCPMCAWAIIQSRIKKLYFGSYNNLYGAFGSKTDLRNLINSALEVKGGIMEEECDNIIKKFFNKIRNDQK